MLTRFRQLSWEERADLLPAASRLLLVQLLLPFGIQRTARWLGRGGNEGQTIDTPLWQRRTRALSRASRLVPGAHCLSRALALRWWMRGAGLPAELVIGADRAAEGLHSHAWVEAMGQRFDTGAAPALTEIQRL